ncbi:MAG: acetyl-CoA carboxylase biotin carboxylase subunit, partial [Alphaproteobacteria bacterium]|nr:acetyl-CoA carboxylase biotin carboxylase subunit [Alphaproteobacteria bacterium]
IHPGVGFLSENAAFAEMVEEHGMTFIGPTPDHIRLMGDKITAKKTALELGIPVVPGSDGALDLQGDIDFLAERIGYPVLIKAASGGGGKGMKVAYSSTDIEEALRLARTEAKACFGNDEVYMEKYLGSPRHIEVQVIGDTHGNVVHLGERDCSLQRRHQKVWEEAPSPAISPEIREKLGKIVVQAMKKLEYRGVGTIEFLYEEGDFYFIEMNTRLQVEHPITEMITGIDLVREQIRVAAGFPLSFRQEDIQFKGHAIECRINAEDAETFIPSPGKIQDYLTPGGYGVRIDSSMYQGYQVLPHYDSLIAKLIVHGANREECLKRVSRALHEYVITGINTLLPLHCELAEAEDVIKGDYDIHWLEKWLALKANKEAA